MAKELIESRRWSDFLPGVRLFKPEIEQLQSYFGGVKIEVGNTLYDTVDEVKADYGDYIKSFRMSKYDDKMSLDLRVGEGVFVSGYDDLKTYLLVRSFLTERIRFIAKHYWALLTGITGLNLICQIMPYLVFQTANERIIPLVLVACLYFPTMVYLITQQRVCRISTLKHHEYAKELFWERNKDKILVGVGLLIIGLVVGWFANTLKEAIKPAANIEHKGDAEPKQKEAKELDGKKS